jgi:hypothetical protein
MMTQGTNLGSGYLGIDSNAHVINKYFSPVKVVDGALFNGVMCGPTDCLARASNNYQIAYTVRVHIKILTTSGD